MAVDAKHWVKRRNGILRSFVAFVVGERARQPIHILEVGSMTGESAIVWHQALRDHNDGLWHIVCIDPWTANEGKAGVGQQLDNDQNRQLASGEAFAQFQRNIAEAGAADSIEIRRGFSDDVLPTLAPGSFDIVYIDGDHSYAQVRKDLAHAEPLVRDGGLLCGDDLEVLFRNAIRRSASNGPSLAPNMSAIPPQGLGSIRA